MTETASQQRFRELFAESEAALYGFVYSLLPNRIDADDILQETLLLIWEHFDQYDPQRPFLPWACTYAYRQVLKHRRRERTHRRHFSEATIESLVADHPQQTEWQAAHREAAVHCVGRLSDEERRLIHARYFGDGKLTDLAETLGRSVNSLYKQLHRVRAKLADCVTRYLAREGSE